MPVLKHAKKKLRQDKKRTDGNRKMKDLFKKLIKQARAAATPEAVSTAFKTIDKAAKKNVIHPNKAARLKARLTKSVATKGTETAKVKKVSPKAKAAKLAASKAKKTSTRKSK